MFVVHQGRGRSKVLRVGALLAVLFVLGGTAVAQAAPAGAPTTLMVAASADAGSGKKLARSTIGSGSYVYLSGAGNVTSVSYYVDDAAGAKKPIAVKTQAPFRLGPLKIMSSNGNSHSILAVMKTASGGSADLFARFKVRAPAGANGESTDNETSGQSSNGTDADDGSSRQNAGGLQETSSNGDDEGNGSDADEDGGAAIGDSVKQPPKDPGSGEREGGNGWRPRATAGAKYAEETWGCKVLEGKACVESVGGEDRDNPASDHSDGRAVDIMLKKEGGCPKDGDAPNTLGDEIAKWYKTNAKAMGVSYVIWENNIWNTGEPMGPGKSQGKSGCTYAHWDHVHVSYEK